MVSVLFSIETLTSSGFTPGSSATIFTDPASSTTSQAGAQAEVSAPASSNAGGQLPSRSSSSTLNRRSAGAASAGRRVMREYMRYAPCGCCFRIRARHGAPATEQGNRNASEHDEEAATLNGAAERDLRGSRSVTDQGTGT